MKEATKREDEWKIKIIENYWVFSKFVRKNKAELIKYLTFMDVKINHTIFKENEKPDYVYFIYEGKFEVTKTIYQEWWSIQN